MVYSYSFKYSFSQTYNILSVNLKILLEPDKCLVFITFDKHTKSLDKHKAPTRLRCSHKVAVERLICIISRNDTIYRHCYINEITAFEHECHYVMSCPLYIESDEHY